MDIGMFESLLREEEGVSLDFKRDRYRFARATDDDKSELLKDILGFANAWRRADSYILIGVADVRGDRGNVIGVTEHLDDHSLQQFVTYQTNRPVRFHYEAFRFEDKDVGIIRIDLAQSRPIYLKRDFGSLKAREVYVRRGSSTDPKNPASPEEIAEMGRSVAVGRERPELGVQFAEIERDLAIGDRTAWEAVNASVPPAEDIPDFVTRSRALGIGVNNDNRHFYRQFAKYAAFMSVYKPVRLLIENLGATAARDVRLELPVSKERSVRLASHAPSAPERMIYLGLMNTPELSVRPARREPGDVEIVKAADGARLEVDCGDMQPGRSVWSEKFYVAITESGTTRLEGHLLAATLPEPRAFALIVEAAVTNVSMSLDDLRKLSRQEEQRR
jgi:Schlafen, AlbA_2